MSDDLLVLNSGSSSLKFAVYAANNARGETEPRRRLRGQITGLDARPRFEAKDADGDTVEERDPSNGSDSFGQDQALDFLLDWLDRERDGRPLHAAGHRVVHGGQTFQDAVRVKDDVLDRLEALVPLAPLHQPHNIAPIRSLAESRPNLFQAACFDTAFHHTQSALERRLALPRHIAEQGVMRYGFHGLSYEYIAGALAERLGKTETGRVIVAHLGSGASLAALRDGVSVATTMGFTALDGLPMSTRCGSLDPGAVLYLLQEKGMSPEDVTTLLYEQSGLLGMSGISGDMRTLLDSDEPAAEEAVAVFVHRTVREIGALVAVLGGLDHLVFTGGIGEHSSPVRERVCRQLDWLGVELDPGANRTHAEQAQRERSRVGVWIIPTDEERMIARHSLRLLREEAPPS
ncbi:acetate/propionate family kinase [Thioalkalivibrio sp.]|uniref:acetate/propionate family kinase n=1 Tax=Thioalkalivibrio sp. TaxID=2093813 RepID=UPI0012D5F75B|nr:acetate/propionate family kinase [Thioalkalivibrio sp.]TVP81742.1 MAG: acetate/propionate family kinase [Thioalkalivibrio sp.]